MSKIRYLTSLLFLVWFDFRYAYLRDDNIPFEAIVIYCIVQIASILKKTLFTDIQLHAFLLKRHLKTSKKKVNIYIDVNLKCEYIKILICNTYYSHVNE